MADARYQVLPEGILDAGGALDAGCWMLDTGYWMLDVCR